MSDVVGGVFARLGVVFGRLGVAGAILIAAFFIFGVLAGAVVVNRLNASPTADVQEQGEGQAEKAEQSDKAEQGEDKGHSKQKHPNNGQGQKQKASEKSTANED